jgi:Ras GTPase-activating-like protein IQGAP2/3
MYINVAVQYIRPKQSFYIRESLRRLILEVVEADDLDLEVDPSIVRLHHPTLFRLHLITQSL